MELNREHVLSTPEPGLICNTMRGKPRKEIAKAIRVLFRDLGIKGVSVTTPQYAGATAIEVGFPMSSGEWKVRGELDNPIVWKINAIIISAFPDLEDREDLQDVNNDVWIYVKGYDVSRKS